MQSISISKMHNHNQMDRTISGYHIWTDTQWKHFFFNIKSICLIYIYISAFKQLIAINRIPN